MKIKFERVEAPFVFEATNESGATCLIDAKEVIGGKNKGMRPMELVATGLAGCASIDVIHILNKQKITLVDYKVAIEAERSAELPSAFTSIHLAFEVKGAIDAQKLDRAISLALEKYCSVAGSLNSEIKITYAFKLLE